MTLVGDTLFYSGVAWLPYTILLFYLCYEHHVRHRFPQNLVLFLLALGAAIRSIWYLSYDPDGPGPVGIVLNRISILLQFSALSVLLMMWSRALKITQHIDRINTINPTPTTPAERLQGIRVANEQSLQNLKNIKEQNRYLFITIMVNIIVWLIILGSIAFLKYGGWYNANIIMLSLVCLFAGLLTMFVGVRTSIKLQNELKPVYQSNTILSNQFDATPVRKPIITQRYYTCGCGLIALVTFIFASSQNSHQYRGLQMQREVLKTLLSVSAIVCFFFTIRSFGFIYTPIVYREGNVSEGSDIIDAMMFPLFMYTFPETIPTIAIAVGISPPSGIMRRYFMPWLARAFCMDSCGLYNASLYNDNFTPRESIGSGTRSREGSFHRTSLTGVDPIGGGTPGSPNGAEANEMERSSSMEPPQAVSSADGAAAAAESPPTKAPFSFTSFFTRYKNGQHGYNGGGGGDGGGGGGGGGNRTDGDTRSVASGRTSHSQAGAGGAGGLIKHGSIYGGGRASTSAHQNIQYETEHTVFDSDDLDSAAGQTESFSSAGTSRTSASNRSSSMQSFSISKPIVIDQGPISPLHGLGGGGRSAASGSRHVSGHVASAAAAAAAGAVVAGSADSDYKLGGSYGSTGTGAYSTGSPSGWRTWSTNDELSRFRKESEEYSELIYRVNSFGTNTRSNSRQDSSSTHGTLQSAHTSGSGAPGDVESGGESSEGNRGFFGKLMRGAK